VENRLSSFRVAGDKLAFEGLGQRFEALLHAYELVFRPNLLSEIQLFQPIGVALVCSPFVGRTESLDLNQLGDQFQSISAGMQDFIL
jgi:hypothetical protein